MRLWPRLPLPRARAIAISFAGRTPEELQAQPWQGGSVKLFAPTGGVRVDDATLHAVRRNLDRIAEEAGYPVMPSRPARRRFDDATIKLLADLPVAFGEALRPEMWAWIAVVLAPHLVQWRWGGAERVAKIERFAGSLVRNTFGRLWYQAVALALDDDGDDRWRLVEEFGADQAVALLERPSLAANRAICLAVGRVWAGLPAPIRYEKMFREAMKALTLQAGIQRLDVLDPGTLEVVVEKVFYETSRRLETIGRDAA